MNKAVKRILTAGVAAVLTLSCFTGCGPEQATTDNAVGSTDKVYQVGICQLVQHPALDAATKGFKDALVEEFGNDGVKFDEQNAAGDSATCATITNGFAASNVDLIFANATAALQAATSATSTIPIVATSITDYATALGMSVSDWTGVTGINVTGTADLAPLDEQAAMINELFPDVKQVGILYCSAEPNSQYQASVIEESLDKSGIAYKEYTTADTNDIVSVVTAACNECDVLYIPTDNTLASAAETVNSVAGPAGVPIIAGEEGICEGCGVATLSISYYSIGYEAGKMAADILVNGKNPAEMEIKYAQELTKKYVPERVSALNITIPSDYEAIEADAEE